MVMAWREAELPAPANCVYGALQLIKALHNGQVEGIQQQFHRYMVTAALTSTAYIPANCFSRMVSVLL
jgi:hypothetical protein